MILDGPAILVARKGYGGRLSVIEADSFIVHEDGYAISPSRQYLNAINLAWFSGHYSTEFQSHRSSIEGIGDFPRAKLVSMEVVIPRPEWQLRCSELYRRRDGILEFIKTSPQRLANSVDEALKGAGTATPNAP